jgi:hypothetical protein
MLIFSKTSILLVTAEGLSQLKWTWFSKARSLNDVVTFDIASRGPSGAIALLLSLKLKHLLASIGAFITVLALATDPFAQQIIRYHDCMQNITDAAASIPRKNDYTMIEGGSSTFEETLKPGIQHIIEAGVFASAGPPAAACSTGNCTWPNE